jgi:hypothetical protein
VAVRSSLARFLWLIDLAAWPGHGAAHAFKAKGPGIPAALLP